MGVIGKTPIHIEWQSDSKDKVNKISEMKIDCGFSSKEEAQKYVSIGDPIVVMDIPFESPMVTKFSLVVLMIRVEFGQSLRLFVY